MNVVTGATGLLGSHIVEQLCKRGLPVRALVRPGSDVSWLEKRPVELVEGDITNPESLRRAFRGAKVVYHSAARVGDWGPWPEFEAITIQGTRNVIDAAEAEGATRLLHISSISVYGHVDGKGKVFDETAPLGQKLYRWSYYSRAKVQAEHVVWEAHRKGRIQATVIRPSWLYGPRDRMTIGRLILNLERRRVKLIGDGNNRLNVVYAGNVAEAAITAVQTERAIGEAYNCSNDGMMTQRQYFNMVARAVGAPEVTRSVPYPIVKKIAFLLECHGRLVGREKPPMITRYAVWLLGRKCFFETVKAKEHLGWKPTVSYEEGIPMTVEWYRKTHNGTASGGQASGGQASGGQASG